MLLASRVSGSGVGGARCLGLLVVQVLGLSFMLFCSGSSCLGSHCWVVVLVPLRNAITELLFFLLKSKIIENKEIAHVIFSLW